MKTKQVMQSVALIAILLISGSWVMAQNGNRAQQVPNNKTCLQTLPNLTNDQQKQITALNDSHQKAMDVLRNERRSTTDERSKAEIRIKMIDLRDAHRTEVSKLLTTEQLQVYYNMNRNNGQMKNKKNNGKGGKGQGKGGNCGHSGRCQRS